MSDYFTQHEFSPWPGWDPDEPRQDGPGGPEQQELLLERDEPEAEAAEGRGPQVLLDRREEGPERPEDPEIFVLVRNEQPTFSMFGP